jgi:hypothetical protein
MQQRSRYLFLLVTVLLIGLFYYYGVRGNKTRYEWNDSGWEKNTYSETSEQPYGTRIFYNMLDGYFPNQSVSVLKKNLVNELPAKETDPKGTYVFVGAGVYLDSADTQHLLQFVKNGNTALLISKTIPFDLMNLIYYEECPGGELWEDYRHLTDSTVTQYLIAPDSVPPAKTFFARQNIASRSYDYSIIGPEVFCPELPNYPIGYINRDSHINFAAFPYGKGRFLLHTIPLSFSNFHLLRSEMQPYAAGVLSHLPEGPIWWDGFSRVPEMVTRQRNNSRSSGDRLPEDHLLSFILKRESLAWAWYILLGLGLLYIVFRTLRKQRPIPVLPKNENSSYEFINTIADLHHKSANYKGISIQAMKLFLVRIREKYGLSATVDPETDLISRMDDQYFYKLSQRSGVPQAQIEAIFNHYATIARFEPTEQHAVDFYVSMEQFLKKME